MYEQSFDNDAAPTPATTRTSHINNALLTRDGVL